MNNKSLNTFMKTRNAYEKVEKAILAFMPHVYSNQKVMDKVANRKDWLEVVIGDGKSVLETQYELAGKPK